MESWNKAQSIVGTSKGRPKNDFYPTPPIATEKLLNVETFYGKILEPACGNGAISDVLINWWASYEVMSSDLYKYGYGLHGIDFLGDYYTDWSNGSIITNPPFNLMYQFMEKAMKLNPIKFAYLAKLSLLEGQKRSKLLENTPLKNVWVFRKRIQMTRNGEPERGGGMIAFAWFVWERDYDGKPMIGWI